MFDCRDLGRILVESAAPEVIGFLREDPVKVGVEGFPVSGDLRLVLVECQLDLAELQVETLEDQGSPVGRGDGGVVAMIEAVQLLPSRDSSATQAGIKIGPADA